MAQNQQDKVFCDHCNEFVSRKTKYNHKMQSEPSFEIKPMSKYVRRKRRFEELDASEDPISRGEIAGVAKTKKMSESLQDELFLHLEHHDHHRDECPNVIEDSNPDADLGRLETEKADAEAQEINKNSPRTDQLPAEDQDSGTGIKSSPSPLNIVSWIIASLLSIQMSHNLSDSCITKLLLLLSQIFSVLSPFSSMCKLCANIVPKTLYSARKLLNIDRDNFKQYVVCPNCCALHDLNSVTQVVNGTLVAKKCDRPVYSCRSANRSSRKKGKVSCDTDIMKKVVTTDGKTTFVPLKVYCFNSVIETLEKFLQRPNFIEKSNLWRNREIKPNLYADIYDGNIWKNFVNIENSDFLNRPHDFGCMINVDWYQPFSRRSDKSVGAIYLVFLNLPREERFKKENCVLVGVMPPLSKEPESLASFLEPLVTELKALWKGVPMLIPGLLDSVTVRMALMCAAADIPAARKLCGYLGHGAIQGCSHCSKPMWSKDGRDCGIPDSDKWPLRTREDHVKWTKKTEAAQTLTRKKEIEKQHGYRFTPLLQLPYFNPSKMTAVDPMHNLFLGTAKKMFAYWVEQGILSKIDLTVISTRIQAVQIPSNIGRIPTNISSNYGQMTAKEWKNWVLIYSLFCLHGILNTVHLRIWQTFVLACRHFCQPVIARVNLDIGNRLMRKFCVEVTTQYGKEFITPNMHLHCHIVDSIENFGSVYGFWLFSFERYNGLLSDMSTNMKDLPVQLMRKFSMFSNFHLDAVNVFFKDKYLKLSELTLKKYVTLSTIDMFSASTSEITEIAPSVWSSLSSIQLPESSESFVNLNEYDLKCLQTVYSHLYQENIHLETLSRVAQQVSSLKWNNSSLVGDRHTLNANGIVCAMWADDHTRISTTTGIRPAKIKDFIIHNLQLLASSVTHVFARVEWFQPSDNQFGYFNPITVWSSKFQNEGSASLLPVQRIDGKCAWFKETHNMQRFIVVCPVTKASYL